MGKAKVKTRTLLGVSPTKRKSVDKNKKKAPTERKRPGLPPVPPADRSPPPPPDPDPLSPTERLFIESYLIDFNATWAYREVYGNTTYNSARALAPLLMRQPRIQQEIRAGIRAHSIRHRLRADHVLRELLRIAFLDPAHLANPDGSPRAIREMPKYLRRCIASVKWIPATRTTPAHPEYRFWNKMEALKMLCVLVGYSEPLNPQDLMERTLQLLTPDAAQDFRTLLAGTPETPRVETTT